MPRVLKWTGAAKRSAPGAAMGIWELSLLREPQRIGPAEAWRLVSEGRRPVFLDTRNARHWGRSDEQIPGTLRIWREELEERIGEVPRGRPVVTYCA